jgi:hypothetical protein
MPEGEESRVILTSLESTIDIQDIARIKMM